MHIIKAGTRVALQARFKTGDGVFFETGSAGTVEYRTTGGRLLKVSMDGSPRSLFIPSDFPLKKIQNETKELHFREGAD